MGAEWRHCADEVLGVKLGGIRILCSLPHSAKQVVTSEDSFNHDLQCHRASLQTGII